MNKKTQVGQTPSSRGTINVQNSSRRRANTRYPAMQGGNNVQSSSRMVNRQGARTANKKESSTQDSKKMINILDKVVSVCIFMLFFGLPLFFINMTYQGISFEKQYYFYFWVFIGVIAWAARGVMGGKIEIRRTSLDIPIGIFWMVYVLATIFSVDKYHSFFGFFGNPINGLMSVTAIILAYYLVVSFATKKRVMLMWWTIVISGSIVTIWSFLATMRFIPQNLLDYIIPSLTGSFTSLAAFLAMMLPIFIISTSLIGKSASVSGAKEKILTALFFIITAINLMTLSLLFGYVKWYIVIIAVALLLVFTVSKFVKVSQKTSMLAIISFLIIVAFYIFDQPILTRTAIQPEASVKYSLSFDVVKDALKNKPIIGSGPGTYGYNFSLYRPEKLNESGQYDIRFFSDRGVLLESLSTIGIIGALALIVVCLSYISNVVHAFMKVEDEDIKVISLGLFVTSVMAMLYVMLWSVDGFIVVYGVLVAATTLGLLRSGMSNDTKLVLSMSSTPQNALTFAFLSIMVAVGVIFGFVTLGKMFVADVHAGKALKARAEQNFEESSKEFTKAVSFNDKEGRYYTIISQYGLDLANIELAKGDSANKDSVSRYVKSAAGTAAQGRDLMPNDVLANETAGFIFENSGGYINGALNSAISAYEAARALEPQNPYLDIAVGKLKLMEAQSSGDEAIDEKNKLIQEAKELFESAKEKTTFEDGEQEISIFAPAHYYIAITEEALNNIDEAIKSMMMALQITQMDRSLSQQQLLSRQVNYGFNLARLLQVRGSDEDNKNAENLLLQIIGVNDQEINSHLNLALLYEKTGRSDEALEEYKKILHMIPETDEKSRENIQGLIDTVEQGGSNVDASRTQDVNDGMDKAEDSLEENNEETVEDETQNISLLIISGNNSESDAEDGQKVLSSDGYEAEIRKEDRDISGVVIMYGGETDKGELKSIKEILERKFDKVESERNDEEVSTYNHDIVVVVGKTTEEASDEENTDENE
ncbi:MAG: hypothetical protein ACKUBY_05340 [Candidatus Moraniibacteriota bacterium]